MSPSTAPGPTTGPNPGPTTGPASSSASGPAQKSLRVVGLSVFLIDAEKV